MARKPTEMVTWIKTGEDGVIWEYRRDKIDVDAILTVDRSQWAVFLKGGQILASMENGEYTLSRKAYPVLDPYFGRSLKNLKGFFNVNVIFVSRKQFVIKWQTKADVPFCDDNGGTVPTNVSGEFVYMVDDPSMFVTKILDGTPGSSAEEVTALLKIFLREYLAKTLSKECYADIYVDPMMVGEKTLVRMKEDFAERGIKAFAMKITDVSTTMELSEEMQKELDARFEKANEMVAVPLQSSGGDSVAIPMNGAKKVRICPHCEGDLTSLPKTPKFCSLCAEPLR